MAREAGKWARSIPFTVPRAPYAPSDDAPGFPEPVPLPADPAELGRAMARDLRRVLDESRDRHRA